MGGAVVALPVAAALEPVPPVLLVITVAMLAAEAFHLPRIFLVVFLLAKPAATSIEMSSTALISVDVATGRLVWTRNVCM